MPFSFSSRSIRQRPSVQAMQTGGYKRAEEYDPNNAARNVNNYASNTPTHVAGGMSAQEYNALNAASAQSASEASRDEADEQGGLAKVVQGIKSVGSSKAWDSMFGALQRTGADRLSTGAASGMEMGDYAQDPNGNFSRGTKPGFFDTPSVSAMQQNLSRYLDASDSNRRRF